METRASYILVGSFVLGLIGAAFAFVVWLASVEFEEAPTRYVVYFEGSVTGLSIASAVRYRGVPVGSVTDIRIDPENIERIRVTVEISAETPVKTDTEAMLHLQGITGIAFIHLSGCTQQSGAEQSRAGRRAPPSAQAAQARRGLHQPSLHQPRAGPVVVARRRRTSSA